MRNVVIDDKVANLSDTVKLMVTGTRFTGKQVDYEIFRNVRWWWDDKIAQSSTKGFTTWLAGEDQVGGSQEGDYYFKATVGGDTEQSALLGVFGTENSKPIAEIIKPEKGDIFMLNANIDFEQTSYDVDDVFDYTWDTGDGTLKTGDSINFNDYNFQYSYSATGTSGEIEVLLDVVDRRSLTDSDNISIIVIDPSVDKRYIFANISKPIYDGVVNDLRVNFQVHGSYALEYDAGAGILYCFAGDCPLQTVDGTQIVDPGPPGNPSRGNFSYINFTWEFDEPEASYINVRGDIGAEVYKTFSSYDEHFVNLTIFLYDDVSIKDNVHVKFRTQIFNGCSRDGRFWYKIGVPIDTVSVGKCEGIDGIMGSGDDCCPDDHICTDATSPLPKCVYDPGLEERCRIDNIKRCNDYDNEPDCLNDSAICRVGRTGEDTDICGGGFVQSTHLDCGVPGSGIITTYLVRNDDCRCEWDDQGTVDPSDDQCELFYDITPSVSSIPIIHTCSFSVTSGQCIGNFMDVEKNGDIKWDQTNIDAVKISQAFAGPTADQQSSDWLDANCGLNSLCPSGLDSYLCGDDTVGLSFFGIWHMIIGMMLIGLVYIMRIRHLNN